jgi:hypothetical protein
MIVRVATALGLTLITAWSIHRIRHTPTPLPATAPDTVFSAARALEHVSAVAQRPHPLGTAEHDRVRDYIVAQLRALGIESELQTTTAIGTRYREAGRIQNILGYLPGSASNGKALLLMVHYDGVGAGPAAGDDGAGVGALLETLRALRARAAPLRSDVIALFTDGEEAGLLGAAAFVREHPRAKDVAVALNFEARGTSGRSTMFETGPGNLDAVRALRTARDVTAGSIFTTIYRALPNDTDLSELSLLGVPAMNFAFADGVERYHTSHDDLAHLDSGSVQHHGLQMLALTTALAGGRLPRPVTGDAVFFDFPVLGLIIYPMWVAMPLAVLLVALTVFVLSGEPEKGRALLGALAMIATVASCAVAASFVEVTGPALWSGAVAGAFALAAVGVNAAVYLLVDRQRTGAAHMGALLVWVLLGATLSFAVPAVSYIFVWPALFALVARHSRHVVAEWVAALVALVMLAGFAYSAAAVMLGVTGAGAAVLVVLASMLVWLLAPLVARAFATWWAALGLLVAASVCFAVFAKLTVKQTPEHPARSRLVYAENADGGDAFLGAGSATQAWTRDILGDATRGPDWTARVGASARYLVGHSMPSMHLEPPTASLVSDSTHGGVRSVVVRVNAASGTTAIVVRAVGVTVERVRIDGRVTDTTRFRRRSPVWSTQYWNVPPEGAVFAFDIPAGEPLTLDLSAHRPGLPAAMSVPARPANVVASDAGDESVVLRRVRFAPSSS